MTSPLQGVSNFEAPGVVARLNVTLDDQFDADGVVDVRGLINGWEVKTIWGYNDDEVTINVEVRMSKMAEGEFIALTLLSGYEYHLDILEIRQSGTDAEYLMVAN